MRNNSLIFLYLIIISSVFISCVKKVPLEDANYVESYTSYTLRKLVSPEFYFQPLVFYKDSNGRVDIYLKVGYNKLVFLKENNFRVAKYNCKITIINEENDSIVIVNEFEKKIVESELNDEKLHFFDFTLKSFNLNNGTYIISVKISDLNSNKFFSKIDRVTLNYSKDSNLYLSDILLLNKVASNNDKIKISPIINKHIPFFKSDSIYSFFEVYTNKNQDCKIEINLSRILYYWDKETDFVTMYRNIDTYSQRVWDIINYQSLFTTTIDTVLKNKTNQLIFGIPFNVRPGNYLLSIKIKSNDGKDFLQKSVKFNILSEGFPKILNIDDKIAVSKIVRRIGEKDFFPENMTEKEKYEKFEKFWAGSNTWNREEFFKRAELANERFTSVIEGWKTPMGKVYIVCGEPDYIDGDRWIYLDQVVFDFAVVRDRSRYEVEEPIVVLRSYTDNAYNFWYRCIDKSRTY